MLIYFLPISFLFGILIGSFLNVVIYRYNTGKGVDGRSQCLSCSSTLSWYELIPVFSFVALRGKCKNCGSKISLQYPLVELVTGILFALCFWFFFTSNFYYLYSFLLSLLFGLTASCLLVVISVYDLRHKIVPDGLVYAFVVLGFVQFFVTHPFSKVFEFPMILDLLAGPILFLPFFLLWFISGGRWMGLGDGKLALGIGAFLGLARGLSAVVLGFWIGAAWSLLAIVYQKVRSKKAEISGQLGLKSEIPFAPFLILGFFLAWFLAFDFFQLHFLLPLM